MGWIGWMAVSDLISRKSMLEFAHNHIGGRIDCNDIARFPAIEAEPVRHGEWIKTVFTDTGKFAGYTCSECGLGARKKFSYCHCGAKMDGGKNDEN
jgi:hypothetical protein